MVGVGRGGGIDTEVCIAEDMMTVDLKGPQCQVNDSRARSDGNAYKGSE